MRRRTLVLLVALVLALAFGFTGRAADVQALKVLSGLCWLVALVLGLALLPFWNKVLPAVPAMAGLFQAVPGGGRWCAACGTPASKGDACAACGAAPRGRGA